MSATAVVDARQLEPGTLSPPVSKSDAQRALVLAHAWGRPSLVDLDPWREGLPDDVRILEHGLTALRGYPDEVEVDCGDGGAPFRFLLTQAALTPGKRVRLRGSARLAERPHQPLVDALLDALGPFGLRIARGNPWPVTVEGADPEDPIAFRIRAAQSSQFASSVLLGAAAVAAWTGHPVPVTLEGGVASEGYFELTVEWMRRFGFEVARAGAELTVGAHQPPQRPPTLPGDWSSLGYLLVIAWRSRGAVSHVEPDSRHPDRAVTRILEGIGLRLTAQEGGTMRVDSVPGRGLTADGAEAPDLLPTLAALACALPAPSTLHHVEILRAKESDRLDGIQRLVAAGGGQSRLDGTTLVVDPPEKISRQMEFDPRGDHRMAMAAVTLAALGRARLNLRDPDCVSKSFPRFWDQAGLAGIRRTG